MIKLFLIVEYPVYLLLITSNSFTETINDVCSDFKIDTNKITSDGINMIFMVGVGYELNNKWEYTTSTTWTGGIELLSGYCTSATLFDTRMILNFLNMGSNPDNTSSDLVVLVAKKLASNSTANPLIVGLINYIESL